MTQNILYINTGTSANKGDGDSLRNAFFKVNKNFELLSITTGFNTDAVKDTVAEILTDNTLHYGINFLYTTSTHHIRASLTTATSTVIGGVKIGSGINITTEGVISAAAAYQLPTATNVVVGGVRVGIGLSADQYGVLNNTGVRSFNNRTGPVALNSQDIENALGFPPVSAFLLGTANGVATLDSLGKIPLSQIGDNVLGALNYKGTWNAQTNVPPLLSGIGTKGDYYKVAFAGTQSIDGLNVWNIGDLLVFNGTNWDKIDGILAEVVSVAGRTGDVVLSYADINGNITRSAFSATSTATSIALGTVKIGAGIQSAEDGTISVDTRAVSTATTSTLGLIKLGYGLSATADGTVSASVANGIQDITFSINEIGTLNPNEDLVLRPTSGVVRLYSTLLPIVGNNALVLRTNQFLNAGLATDSTNFSLRIVGDSNSGSNLFDAGIYNSPIATTGWSSKMLLRKTGDLVLAGSLEVKSANGIKFSDGSIQTTAAVISTATNVSVGGIIVGNGLAINGDGVLSALAGTTGGYISSRGPGTIASSTDNGDPGEVAYDGSYFYLCVSVNVWVRIPLGVTDAPGTW